MHIGIDARYLGEANTGLAYYSENLLEALARIDSDNQYTVYVNASLNRRLKLGPNFRLVPLRGRPNSFRSMLRFSAAVRAEDFDLLHVHFPLAPVLADCPIIITVHDMLPYVRESNIFALRFRPWRILWSYMIYPMALMRAKWIICVSHATRDSLSRMFPNVFQKTIIVHSGGNPMFRARVEAATVELIRSRLNLPEHYILYSGSTRADKNIEGMLQAFARLRQRNPAMDELFFVLDISGEEINLALLQRLVAQYGVKDRVRLIRNAGDEERRVIFEDARALFLLSRYEGFCFPILEAQACSLPVLAADSGALPEIAGEHGAVFVDPDNLEEIVSMLERVLLEEDLRAYLVEHGHENTKRFEWPRAAEQIKQIYEFLFYPRDLVQLPRRGPGLLRPFF